jgi:uncharacterized membrane protein
MESHSRSIIKAVTYRITGTVVTIVIALMLTGTLQLSLKIGLLDTAVKILLFYGHERAWNKLPFGKAKSPEYQI